MTWTDLDVLVPPFVRTVPFLYFLNALEDSTSVMVPACFFQARDVPFWFPAKRQESFSFSSDQKLIFDERVEQRLDTITISGRYEQLTACIIDT